MLWVIITAVTLLAFIISWIFMGMAGITIVAGLLAGIAALTLMYQYAYIHLNEMEVGVLFNRERNFSRFLQPGHHFINPLAEYLDSKLPKGSQTTKGTARQIRTKEGISVSIQWDVSFFIDVTKIKPGIEHKMARALPKFAVNIVGGRVLHSLRHIVEKMSIEELHSAGSIKRLEDAVGLEVYRRAAHLGVLEIAGNDIKLGPIDIPPHVEKAIEANYERQLTVEAVDKLQRVIDRFTNDHMEKLAELERLRILDSADAQYFLMETITKDNGRN